MVVKIVKDQEYYEDDNLYLKLKTFGGCGDVYLIACDAYGVDLPGGNLLAINHHGVLFCGGISTDINISLENGSVRVRE